MQMGGIHDGEITPQVYTSEFRQQAVALITRDRLSIAEAARRLAISPKTLLNWVRRAKNGEMPDAGAGLGVRRHEVSEQEAELSRLRREDAELRLGRDILKKASAYFAHESLRATR